MCFMPYPTKPKGGWQRPRQVVVNRSTAQLREQKATQKFVTKYRDILQNNMAEGPKDPQDPFFYQEGGKTYASLPMEMLQNIQKSPLFEENAKGLPGRRHRNPQDNTGKGPCNPCVNPTGIFTKHGSRDNASNGQSSNDEGNGRKRDREQPDEVHDDGVSRYRMSDTAQNSTITKMQVTHISLLTDSCNTLYVTKNALTAYTIAIVQNAQALQYDQMHIALQMARNQASLETPLRAEELMTAHFNIAVLLNETDINKMPDAQKPEATTLNALTHQPQLQTTRPMLRYSVGIMLQIAIQRSNTLPEPSPQRVEETTDLLTEYRRVTRLMTLGTTILILMSTHAHTT